MPLTGRFRFRKSLTGKLVLQVEHDERVPWPLSLNGARRRRWRDATVDKLVRPEIRGLLEFEDYVDQIPEANHSARIGPVSRRRLPHEALRAGEPHDDSPAESRRPDMRDAA